MSDDLVKRLRNTPNWMREEYAHYKDGLKSFDRAPFEAAYALEAQAAEITRLRAELATARRDGMEEAAKRLEELHKNHNCDPESGAFTRKLGRYDRWPESAKTAKLEHDAGYYRAIADGVAHIRAALEGKKEVPTMTEEQLREMMRDPRYWRQREPEWVKRVTDGFRTLVGGKKDE